MLKFYLREEVKEILLGSYLADILEIACARFGSEFLASSLTIPAS